MTKEQILQYNKRCAEFLGFKCSINEQYELPKMMTFQPKKDSNLCHTSKVCLLEDMLFHSDWNWIHEVVEFIKNTTNLKQLGDTTFSSLKREVQTQLGRNYKEGVVDAIDNFLIWYNDNTNK